VAFFAFVDVFLPWITQQPTLDRTERDFQANRESLYIIVRYLTYSDYDNISICHNDIEGDNVKMFTGLETGYVPIDDNNIIEMIQLLFQHGFKGISKMEEGVSFLRWSTKDHGRGIVYSIDGSKPTESSLLPFLTETEALTEDNWYFYVENFSEWKSLRNQQQ
jgi:hypothetical protein